MIYLLILMAAVNGIPLESPSQDLSGFFSNSRIVGGVDAPQSYLRYQAALVYGPNVISLMCGGSIISKSHVLTAAHCIDPFITWTGELIASFHVRVGSSKWYEGGTPLKIKSYHNHPNWNSWTLKYDAGLLVTTTDIQFNEVVRPIALGRESGDGGEESFVTGWGFTEAWGPIPRVLQLLYVVTISTQQCKEGVRAAVGEWGWKPPVDARVEICTFVSYGKGMCSGDSGSALVAVRSQEQIGIVSWGFPCAIGAPDVYTRIDGVLDFIERFVNETSQVQEARN